MARYYSTDQRKQLDQEIRGMTPEQRQELERKGRRILRTDGNELQRQAEYMRRYRQRIALACQKQLSPGDNN